MQASSRDWKSIKKDSKEKYNLYLCSREWGLLKEAVRERSGGKCERCKINDMDACHHLSYERKYKEELEDLQAICKECHEFTHGKSDYDPIKIGKFEKYVIDSCRLLNGPISLAQMQGKRHECDPLDLIIEDGYRGLRNHIISLFKYAGEFDNEKCELINQYMEEWKFAYQQIQNNLDRPDVVAWCDAGCPKVSSEEYEEVVTRIWKSRYGE